MDVSFTNILEGARPYFQGLPAANATDGPYFQQQQQQQPQNVQRDQPPNYHQQQQQHHQQQQQQLQQPQHQQHQQVIQHQHIVRQHHQQPFYQQSNDHYAGTSTSTAGSWVQQHSPSEPNRAPSREQTPTHRSSSHSSTGSRTPSYHEMPRQYQSTYSDQNQNHQLPSHPPQGTFQFSRPQSREIPQGHQHLQHVTNSTYQSTSPQLARSSSREQLATATVQNYHQFPKSTGLTSVSSVGNQYTTYQSRSYYATPQTQSLPVKSSSSSSYMLPPQSSAQQTYYKQSSSPQINSIPVKQQTNYYVDSRSIEGSAHNNGQYQTSTSNEQTYRTTHNLPPIAVLSNPNYRTNKTSTSVNRAKVPVVSKTYVATSMEQSMAYTPAAQQVIIRSDSYSNTLNTNNERLYSNTMNQNNQRLNQIPTVITPSYTNVIMTASNTPINQNPISSQSYQTTKHDVQNVPNSQLNQNVNYIVTKREGNSTESSVIKQRKESPLDLSVKTVKTSADSTEGKATRRKYDPIQSHGAISGHGYPTLDINTIKRNLTQRSQSPTVTAPKMEFNPKFNLSSIHSNVNTPKNNEGAVINKAYQETPIRDLNYSNNLIYPRADSLKARYPLTSVDSTPQFAQIPVQKIDDFSGKSSSINQMYLYENRNLTGKRSGEVQPSIIPTKKVANPEYWLDTINHQIDQKISHYKEQELEAQYHPQPPPVSQQRASHPPSRSHKLIEEAVTSALMNGNYPQSSGNHAYNYQKLSYTTTLQPSVQQAYKPTNNNTYQQSKYQHNMPSYPSQHQYSGNYSMPSSRPSQQLYINPAARHNLDAQQLLNTKPNVTGAATKAEIINKLRNNIETKKIEQQKSQDIAISQRTDIQHPSTDVTAPLQPKPGIDRNNISPFTPISVPDPNICKIPLKMIAPREEVYIAQETSVINKVQNEESTVIVNSTNSDYDGLAARIRTKGELKEVTQSQNSVVRDARLQAFLEDTMKSPNRQIMHISSSSSMSSTNVSPSKLLKERQVAIAPRKRLFSRNDEESGNQKAPRREKSSLRSSSETSVFDFPDSDDENERPVLERQTLDAMRKDRRNSLKLSSTPLHATETDVSLEILDPFGRAPSPEDDIFGSICDQFMEQLKTKNSRMIKRITETDIEIKKELVDNEFNTSEVKIKVEVEEQEFSSPQLEQTNISDVSTEVMNKCNNVEENNCKTPLIGNIIKSDSDLSDSEIKKGEWLSTRHKHRVKRKIMSSSESSDNEKESPKNQDSIEAEQKLVAVKEETEIKKLEPNASDSANITIKTEEVQKATDSLETEASKKPTETLAMIRPAKKPSFGDGSDFYPGWEEGVYKYKKSLRMPPSLIHLTRPPTRLSTSLPDLDPCPQSPTTSISNDLDSKDQVCDNKVALKKFKSEPVDSDSESTSSFNIFCKKTNYDSEGSSSIKSLPNTKKENKSILDKLLEKCGGRKKRKHKRKEDHSPKVIPKAENSVELLPTPSPSLASTKSPEKSKGLTSPVITVKSALLPFRKGTIDNFKDAFINSGNNILGVHDKFTAVVLSSRTRKETRAMKQRATIKEVFGEDRPASAPPVTCVNDIQSKKSDQIFEPFSKTLDELMIKKEKIDDELVSRTSLETTPDKKCKVTPIELLSAKIKQEIIDEDNKKLIDLVSRKDADACSETMSLDGGEEPGLTGKRKSKFGKIRRKFSSGFDYIRKKKRKREEPEGGSVERKKKKGLPTKTPESIDDIQKEIKSWVLNKGIGESHLHRAARLGYVDITAYCLEKMDCSPDPKDNAGYTPLHEACARGHLEIAKLLLKYGANVHQSAKGGIRPLHEAIENGFVEIVRLLLSYGADPSLATYAGLTPLSLASDENTKKLLDAHLHDKAGEGGPPWPFYGPATCFDPEESGYDALENVPKEESDAEMDDIAIDMSEALLPNLYTLRGEPPTERWVLLQDLSHFLKIKSRDALLRQISIPSTSNTKVNYKSVLKELKMSDFLEQAHCCQFLNMGEKINSRASKIALVKYTDRVRELLGIESAIVTGR